jgi:hypothetical protein
MLILWCSSKLHNLTDFLTPSIKNWQSQTQTLETCVKTHNTRGRNFLCRNPNFGLATKAKGLQGCGPRRSPRVTSHTPEIVRKCEGVWGSMREWTLTFKFPRQLPLWEMESRWILETSERNFRGQNSMAYDVLYIIGNLLERRCLKWALITHLDIWNTSYGQKKRRESNCQFDS